MQLRLATLVLLAGTTAAFAQRPYVAINSPEHGESFPVGNVTLTADARDPDGSVARVDYYVNDALTEWATDPPFAATIYCTAGRYKVQALATDNVGYYAWSAPIYFQVGGEWPVNLLRGPYLQSCTATSIVIRWRTDWPTNGIVWFGTNAPGPLAVTNSARTSEHAVRVVGLQPDTRYVYAFGSSAQTFGSGYPQSFRTAPTGAAPVTVWAIGDFGTGNEYQEAVRDAFLDSGFADQTDLCLMLGDNAYESGTDDEYEFGLFDMYPMLLPSITAWPTIGNHDAALPDQDGRIPYLDIFHLPANGEAGGVPSGTERYYSFDYANIHFICLDSETSSRALDGPMFNWLREDLAASTREWIVAYWHHPPYSSGTHNSETEFQLIEMRERALPVLEAHGVDLVLAGHSHVYERSYLIRGHYGRTNTFVESMKLDGSLGRDDDRGPYRKLGPDAGTVYVVCGNSGQGSEGYPFFFGQQPSMVRSLGGFGSMVLQFDGPRLDVKFLRPDGTYADYFTIDKTQPRLRVVRSGNGLDISWPSSLPGFSLQSAPTLPAVQWSPVNQPVQSSGDWSRVQVPLGSSHQFFRLRRDP